jgi:uncharacterized protein
MKYPSAWAETISGIVVDYTGATETVILLEDIAHALSMTCRFNGHCKVFYSVAEHSVNVAKLVNFAFTEKPHNKAPVVLAALLHDAHEAYVGDVITPMKKALGVSYTTLEYHFNRMIGLTFGVALNDLHPIVKQADLAMLEAERRYYLSPSVHDWGLDFSSIPTPIRREAADIINRNLLNVRPTPGEAKASFISTFGATVDMGR